MFVECTVESRRSTVHASEAVEQDSRTKYNTQLNICKFEISMLNTYTSEHISFHTVIPLP